MRCPPLGLPADAARETYEEGSFVFICLKTTEYTMSKICGPREVCDANGGGERSLLFLPSPADFSRILSKYCWLVKGIRAV